MTHLTVGSAPRAPHLGFFLTRERMRSAPALGPGPRVQGMGQNGGDSALAEALRSLAEKYGPAVKETLKPIAADVATASKPALREVMAEYVPQFALISGAVVGAAFLLGIHFTKKRA